MVTIVYSILAFGLLVFGTINLFFNGRYVEPVTLDTIANMVFGVWDLRFGFRLLDLVQERVTNER